MAKAVATCKCSVCGKEFYVYSYKRNWREAESWEKWAATQYTICDDCKQKQYAEESEQAAKEAQELGLPELKGSAKQIAWAESIRKNILPLIAPAMDYLHTKQGRVASTPLYSLCPKRAMDFIDQVRAEIEGETSASWWIDHRSYQDFKSIASLIFERADKLGYKAVQDEEYAKRAEADREITITPTDQTKGTVDIKLRDDEHSFSATYSEKDESFADICREHRMSKEYTAWTHVVSTLEGTLEDRAAELANHLLRAGYAVKCKNEKVREMAVNATFTPVHTRWIKRDGSDDDLCVEVGTKEQLESLGKVPGVRCIVYRRTGAHHYGKAIIPLARYEEALDFASAYDYRLTPVAQQMVDEAIRRKQSAMTVATPKKRTQVQKQVESILDAPADVLPDLEDTDETAH